ncbi:MAG: amidohydrolase family protein [Ekhidna sp.]
MKNVLSLSLIALSFGVKGQYIIENVQLFDGHVVYSETSLKIESGIITEIGNLSRNRDNLVVIDGTGKTIIPGLINSHVHAWIPYHLKNAMEGGVYAVLDMHGPAEQTKSLRKYKLENGYAKFYSAGYAATVEGGHGTQYGYDVPIINDQFGPKDFIAKAIKNEADYIKIIYEPGLNTLSIKQVTDLVSESHRNNFLAVAHISDYEDAKALKDTQLDGFVHLWKDEIASPQFLSLLKQNEIFIIPTLSVLEGVIDYYRENGIEKKILSLTALLEQIAALHRQGIVLLAGTDPPNVGLDYGWSLHNELELFVKAGLTPLEALKTATAHPSKTFSIENIGTIEKGKIANFNLIDGNPIKEITDSRKIIAQWANGIKIK